MMGPRQVEQGALFYNFSIDAHVPADCLLRSIDRLVDLSEVRHDLAPFHSSMGRPSVDPELMIRIHRLLSRHPFRAAPLRKRSTSIWRTGGSAGSGSTAMSPIIPPSRRTGTAVSARAISCGASLRQSCSAALKRAWAAAKALRLMPASSRRTPTGKRASRASGSPRPSRSGVSGCARRRCFRRSDRVIFERNACARGPNQKLGSFCKSNLDLTYC